jgi:cytochrome c556
MKSRIYTFLSVAAVVAAGACSGGGENNAAEPVNEQQPAANNVAAGNATETDVRAVMKARHDQSEEMGDAMKGIGSALKADSPDVAAIQRHSALIAGFGPQLLTWFPEGSGPEAGKTRAKPEIWTDQETFRAAAQRFQQSSAAFDRTAKGGNVDEIRAALPDLQGSCKNCHDRFRGPDNH